MSFPTKPLGCYGDGGAIFTNNSKIVDICREIRVHGKILIITILELVLMAEWIPYNAIVLKIVFLKRNKIKIMFKNIMICLIR